MSVAGLSMLSLYEAAFTEQRDQLSHTAKSQARSMEVMADHLRAMGMLPDKVFADTLNQVSATYRDVEGFGHSGELILGKLEDGQIVFLLHRYSLANKRTLKSVSFESGLAQPMRQALLGISGTMIGYDYRGAEVLAAYQPVRSLNLGIVTKIDMAEIRAPFIRAGAISTVGAVLIILLGTVLFRRISTPLVDNLEKAVTRLTEAQRIARLGNWERTIETGEGWWSDETYRIFGLEPKIVSPTLETFYKAIHPEDRETVKTAIERCLDGKEPYSIEYRILRPDGSQRTIYGRGTWRVDKTGKPSRISGTVQDITKRRRTEDDVRRLAAAIEELSENFALYGPDDRMVMCNKKFREINEAIAEYLNPGVTFEEQTRAKIEKGLIPEAVGHEEEWLKTRMDWHRNPGELHEIARQDGIWLLIHEQRMADGSTITLSTDITDRKRAEEDLRQALVKAEEANRAKSTFLANMSHELRTPLNSIIGFSDALKTQLFGPLGGDKYREYAEDINASGLHLLEVISDILDISKIEAGELAASDEEVDLPDLVESAIKMLREQAEKNGIMLSRVFPQDCPGLRADPRHIKQIVLNLVSNSLKFTPAGGKIRLEILVGDDQGLLLVVEDTGIGIEESNIEKALEPFGQVGDIYSRPFEGTGLGLPLAKSLAELHGGSLSLESQPGKGTMVTVRFPPQRTVIDSNPRAAIKS